MDLATATKYRDDAIDAYNKAIRSSSYSVGGRSKSNQDLDSLRAAVDHWQRVVEALSGTGGVTLASWT
jgi:hypothetical protein